jgi:hypothetical protein
MGSVASLAFGSPLSSPIASLRFRIEAIAGLGYSDEEREAILQRKPSLHPIHHAA